eukprot:TRINITY_DN4075_c0_g1_i7.p1 TRINITY_DN4075_c0_g1~~TRINITY_DN4075_c0_g1_i7.p1  ORF type:complete len:279 (-),score=36.53 TRINITY_DN4075_c0_g1_i7:66-902(-)
MKPRIIITSLIPTKASELLYEKCEVVYHYENPDQPISSDELKDRLKEKDNSRVEGLFCVFANKIDKTIIESAQNLKVISTMSVGFDHIDVAECSKRNIKVGNTPGVLTEATADLVVGLMLATARKIPQAYKAVKDGQKWPRTWDWMCGIDVYGSTVGIIGLGRIGSAVARRLNGFNCNILYSGPNEKPEASKKCGGATYVALDDLLKNSDFIIPLSPLNKETEKSIGYDQFKMMKKNAVFINASRGNIIDQDALVKVLKEGHLGCVGLDVTSYLFLPN